MGQVTNDDNHWKRAGTRTSRRTLFRSTAIAGTGLAAAALIGCGDSDDDEGTEGGAGTGTAGTTETQAPAATGEAKTGGTIRMYGQDPIGFDPHANFSYRTHQNMSFIHEGLFEVPVGPGTNPTDFSAVPNVAESSEMQDEVTFVVTMQPGVKFQNKDPLNGREVVADDIIYSYQRMVDKKFAYRDLIEGVVQDMQAVDDHTLKFTLTQPYADFPPNLANHYNWIVAHELDDKFGDLSSPDAAIGLGPFMLDSYEPNVKVTYVANPDYFRGRPNVDSVEYLVLPEVATRDSMFRSGELDLVTITTLSRQSIEQSNADTQWTEYFTNGGEIFYYRCDEGQFANDIRVRQAINMAIDRQAWLDSFYLGDGTIYNGPPVLAAYGDWQVPLEELSPEAQALWAYSPDEATKLLNAAGFDLERTYKVDGTAGYGAATVDRMQLAMDMLGQIGIKTEANLKEYGDWLATGHIGVYDDFAFGPMTPQLSLDAWVWGLFHSTSGVNKAHFTDPEIDRLVDATRSLYDDDERKEAIHEANRYIAGQGIYVYAPQGTTHYAAQPWIKNFSPKGGYYPGKTVREAWIDRE